MADPKETYYALGYNTDFQNGYNASSSPATTREDFWKANYPNKKYRSGWDDRLINEYNAWLNSVQNQYNEYKNWYDRNFELNYNSEANKLARLRAIGQNPYYTDQLGNQASISSSGMSGSPEQHSEFSEGVNVVNSFMGSALSLVGEIAQVSQILKSNDMQDEKILSQRLDNRFKMHNLGFDEEFETPIAFDENNEPQGVERHSQAEWFKKFFSKRQYKTYRGHEHGFGNYFSELFDNSLLGHMHEYTKDRLSKDIEISDYKLKNLFKYSAQIAENQAKLSDIDLDQTKKLDKLFDKYVKIIELGYTFNKKRLETDIKTVGLDKWTTEIGKILGAVQSVHNIIQPTVVPRGATLHGLFD